MLSIHSARQVPIRLICTYVGPSTEWLDGYDKQEMENNRSLPPACNLVSQADRYTHAQMQKHENASSLLSRLL